VRDSDVEQIRQEEQDGQIHREKRALRSCTEYCNHANNARDEDDKWHPGSKSNSNLGDHGKYGRHSAAHPSREGVLPQNALYTMLGAG